MTNRDDNAEESRRLKGDLTSHALLAAMQASPHRDIDIEPPRGGSKRETRRFLTAELSDEDAERIASSRMDTHHNDLDKLLDPK